ncbi:uncharacterized protein KY384_008190 [Bacidia gigantensis]|uniref:uncharacterized protein n=1 Tax=Bacidia gigantensis TaxID=2732470 RepID=UPI001D0376D7|nr:uncharacterized protein KY384_008190 [Bacidia gigantensis]KAG8526761.1 hypothetical protein KY384_008190 [Bacidia gigantensis]
MIVRPSFWATLYPGIARRLRERGTEKQEPKKKDKPWNPATFFFWIFILIGSQSINMLVLQNEYQIFSRKADGKIALLREVIEKVQRGEDVDVEKVLGTGDNLQEREWKEVQSLPISPPHYDLYLDRKVLSTTTRQSRVTQILGEEIGNDGLDLDFYTANGSHGTKFRATALSWKIEIGYWKPISLKVLRQPEM